MRAADAGSALEAWAAAGARPDAIVLNPPRRGVTPRVRRAVAALAPRRLVYVSCAPETLARDLAHLARLGYATPRVEPYDLLPLTFEVETVAVLAPSAAPPPRVVHDAGEVWVLDKPPHEPTTPHPDAPSSLLARAQRLAGAPDAVAVHRLDADTSGLVLVALRPEAAGAWAAALAAGQKTYLALVRGVTRKKGVIRRALAIDGRSVEAVTRYRRVRVVRGHSLLEVRPQTGRTHQIRRHLAGLGHPILGDARYGHAPSNRHLEERYGLDRSFLHAARVELVTPAGEPLALAAPLPGDLAVVLDALDAERPGVRG
ncbi:MAG: hypothetical protein KF729_17700 [Sandaracinaceae bacterium]|nr:hypothetical protein [Sandaracinaceae bacterium]